MQPQTEIKFDPNNIVNKQYKFERYFKLTGQEFAKNDPTRNDPFSHTQIIQKEINIYGLYSFKKENQDTVYFLVDLVDPTKGAQINTAWVKGQQANPRRYPDTYMAVALNEKIQTSESVQEKKTEITNAHKTNCAAYEDDLFMRNVLQSQAFRDAKVHVQSLRPRRYSISNAIQSKTIQTARQQEHNAMMPLLTNLEEAKDATQFVTAFNAIGKFLSEVLENNILTSRPRSTSIFSISGADQDLPSEKKSEVKNTEGYKLLNALIETASKFKISATIEKEEKSNVTTNETEHTPKTTNIIREIKTATSFDEWKKAHTSDVSQISEKS